MADPKLDELAADLDDASTAVKSSRLITMPTPAKSWTTSAKHSSAPPT